MKEYLQLTRAHTIPLEAVPAAIGASLAVGEFWSTSVLLWIIAGALYHLTGYGQNSYSDWKSGFDREDRHKQHHPLNSGAISPKRAKWTVYSLFALTAIYVAYLVYPSPLGYAVMATGVISGVIYNYLGKRTVFKFVFISLAHTSMFVLPYISLGGEIRDLLFLSGLMYVFTWVMFQISVSGEIKDITEFDEKNFLRDGFHRGARATDVGDRYIVLFGPGAQIYSLFLKTLNMSTSLLILAVLWPSYISTLVVVPLMFFIVAFTISMLSPGNYDRETRVRLMSIIEGGTLFVFVASYEAIIGLGAVVTLIFGSVLVVVTLNLVEWQTFVAPEV